VAVRAAVIGVDRNANGGGGVLCRSCVWRAAGGERKILIKANDIKKL
jgi:hypothetical protein